MNERDKELAMQAGDYVNKVYTPPVRSKTPGKIWEDGHVGWHTQFNAKFADLIRADEREALIRYFDGHYRGRWSEGQIIEALEARGNT